MQTVICHRLQFMEIIVAMALLAIVSAGAFAGLHANRHFRRALADQNHALAILDNVCERAAGLKSPSYPVLDQILQEEFHESSLGSRPGVRADCRREADACCLQIHVPGNRPLAEMRIPLS